MARFFKDVRRYPIWNALSRAPFLVALSVTPLFALLAVWGWYANVGEAESRNGGQAHMSGDSLAMAPVVETNSVAPLAVHPAPSVSSLTFRSIDTGLDHTCGVLNSGRVVCWGTNAHGKATPPDWEFKSVSAGRFHSCGIRSDDTVVCWGKDSEGVPEQDTFRSVSAGEGVTCGITFAGSLKCWSGNEAYTVESGVTFKQVSLGHGHACAIRENDTVACWGNNDQGESDPPSGRFQSVSAGDVQTCGVRVDGTVACWGSTWHGRTSPPSGQFISVSTTWEVSCGVRTNGSIACWGAQSDGENAPPVGNNFRAVETGHQFACALKTDGSVVCWGADRRDGRTEPPDATGSTLFPPEPAVILPDKIESDTTTSRSYAQLTLTINNPGELVEGSAVVIYLEDDFKVGHIDMNRTYFIGRQVGRVYVTDPVEIDTDDHFGGGDDWDILVRVPDLLPENDTGFDTWSADDATGLKLVLDRAGIRNPTEQGSHSAHYVVLAPGAEVPTLSQPDLDARNLSDLETKAEIKLSVDSGHRGQRVTITGHGFNNNTGAEAFVLGPKQGYDSSDQPTCIEVLISHGDSLGTASVGRNDKFTLHFTVHQDEFAPGPVNWICAADSEAGNPRFANEAKLFALTESMEVYPRSGSPGDTITLKAQDYPRPTTVDPATVHIRGYARSTRTWSRQMQWDDDGDNSNDDFSVDVDGDEYTVEIPHAFPDVDGLPDFFYLSFTQGLGGPQRAYVTVEPSN